MSVALLLSLLGACSEQSEDPQQAAVCKLPSAIAAPEHVPSDFPWPDDLLLTQAKVRKNFVSMEGFSERSVESLFKDARPGLIAKGFDVINTDFEGFEAELYFAKKSSLAGIVSLREGPCDGYVKVNVLYDPLETAAGRKAVKKTRKLSGEG